MHGVTMVFFFLIPSIPAVLGNFLVPLMIGARDLAFPRLNLASWYVFILGGAFTLIAAVAGGVDTGWTFYTPYSSRYSNSQVVLTVVRNFHHGVFVDSHRAQFHRHHPQDARAGDDVVAPAAVHLVALRDQHHFHSRHSGDRDYLGLGRTGADFRLRAFSIPPCGGDPLLFQHLFWFYSHPAVYIMILPGHGRGQRGDRLFRA